MNTIVIPKNLIKEKDLILIPRSSYERLLSFLKVAGEDKNLWSKASKDNFLKSYSKADSVYDKV